MVMKMMTTTKAVLLSLTLVLATVRADVNPAEVTGSWATQAVASDNLDNTYEDGYRRPYIWSADCAGEACYNFTMRFYLSEAGACNSYIFNGQKGADGNYRSDPFGRNYYRFLVQQPGFMVLYNHNVDDNGNDTHMTMALTQGGQLSETQIASYEDATEATGIPPWNIQYVALYDTCP